MGMELPENQRPSARQPTDRGRRERPRDRAVASRAAQGLPPQVEDPAVLANVAVLLRLGRQPTPE